MIGPLQPFVQAARFWQSWLHMAVVDTAAHYRRSILGPFWIAINMMVMVGAMGFVYGYLFNMTLDTYIPYVATGFLAWNLISNFFIEGARIFTANATIIKNISVPLPFFAFKSVMQQMIAFFHQLIIIVPIYILFPANFTLYIVLILPALLILFIDGVAIAIIFGMICCRFRDMPNMISNILQFCFFLTPVFWPASSISKAYIVQSNPFFHFIEIVRAPLIGHAPTGLNWMVSGAGSLLLVIVAGLVFVRYRWRVAYIV